MKLSKHGIQIDKKTGDLIVNITDFGLFSGTYDTLWLNDDHYETEYDYIMEAYENSDIYNVPKEILDIENLTTNDIEIKVDMKKYLKSIGELYSEFFENTFGGTWEYDSHISPKYYNYGTDNIYIKCINPNSKIKYHLLNYQNDILNNNIDPYEIELYNIYSDLYGYECFQQNTIITIKGITI